MTAIMVRGSANPEPFSVCGCSGRAPGSRRKRMFARRAWKSVQLLTELISSHSPTAGDHVSTSYVRAALKPRSPVQISTTR
jgi:hypothetical protein